MALLSRGTSYTFIADTLLPNGWGWASSARLGVAGTPPARAGIVALVRCVMWPGIDEFIGRQRVRCTLCEDSSIPSSSRPRCCSPPAAARVVLMVLLGVLGLQARLLSADPPGAATLDSAASAAGPSAVAAPAAAPTAVAPAAAPGAEPAAAPMAAPAAGQKKKTPIPLPAPPAPGFAGKAAGK